MTHASIIVFVKQQQNKQNPRLFAEFVLDVKTKFAWFAQRFLNKGITQRFQNYKFSFKWVGGHDHLVQWKSKRPFEVTLQVTSPLLLHQYHKYDIF